ncbi:MAG TPA: TonB-dependent receptor [Rhizomicrobium sp.]|nr:TonB-dependent receptor [Rhizomicrobium sp.]
MAWLAGYLAIGPLPALAGAYPPGEEHDFRIAGGALATAIQEFSRQANIQIATALNVADRSGNRVEGHMSNARALAELLKGQPIRADYVAGGYILRSVMPAPEPADAETVEAVTVTDFRGELTRALARKRGAVGSQDSVLAEDIAAFPDRNLAESLQRIPGVSITRDSGEGRQISLRGLGPDFTRTQINGMEVLSNTASGMDNRGLVSRTRSFDYSVFASELFKEVDVEKSWAASQDEGGIGGTIGLHTPEPFDYDGLKAVVSAKGITNSNTRTVTPRLTGLVSDRWGAWGLLVSGAWSSSDSNEFGYRNWGWNQITVAPGNIGPGIGAADAARLTSTAPAIQLFAPQAETYSTWFDHRDRLGITAALQYRPNDRLQMGIDLLYGRLTNDRRDTALAAAGTNGLTGDVGGTQRLNSVVIQQNSIIAADWSHIDQRSEYNVMHDDTDFRQVVWNASLQAAQDLTVHAMAGTSRSRYTLPVFDKVFLESQDHDFSFDDRPDVPVNHYGFNVTDPAQWKLMRLDTQESAITDNYVNGKLDLDWRLDDASNLTFGAEYKRFSNDGWVRTDKEFHNVPTDTAIPAGDKTLVPYDTVANYVVGDVDKTYATIGQIRNLTPAYDVPGSDFAVSEKTWAGYAQYNLQSDVFGMRLRANAGLRYFSTDLVSAGSLNTGAALVPAVIRHHYDDVLPAANAALDITDAVVLRLSANRNISRPSLSDLAAAGSLTTAPFGGTISAGNPNLKPFMADSIEGSLEYYEGKLGYIALGAFYKNMESFITTQTSQVSYAATGYPLSFLLPGQSPNISYNYTAPINGKGAVILGLEAAFQRDLAFLPAPLNHLGFVGNVTLADGSTPVLFGSMPVSLPLNYLSKLSANATLYYETDSWGLRASYAYRSKYLDGAGGGGNIGEAIAATGNVDMAAHYRIDDHLKLVLEGNDLTDQPIVQYTDVHARRPEAITRSGTTYSVGFSYAF